MTGGIRQIHTIISWKGCVPDERIEVRIPLSYLRKFGDSDLLEYIREQSNLFAIQSDVSKSLSLSVELRGFIDITF